MTEHTWLVVDPAGSVAIGVGEAEPLLLPRGSVTRVFERYGQVFEAASGGGGEAQRTLTPGASPDTQLDFTEGLLKRMSHRTWFDVVPRDYLVFTPHVRERDDWPRYELCTSISAALLHLARAYAAAR